MIIAYRTGLSFFLGGGDRIAPDFQNMERCITLLASLHKTFDEMVWGLTLKRVCIKHLKDTKLYSVEFLRREMMPDSTN